MKKKDLFGIKEWFWWFLSIIIWIYIIYENWHSLTGLKWIVIIFAIFILFLATYLLIIRRNVILQLRIKYD